MSEKITGYLLLAAGLILILFSAFQVIQVLAGNQAPIAVVNSTGMTETLPTGQTMEILSKKDLDQFANLTLHYLLFTFLVTVGYRISSLGIQLLRPVVVKLNQKPT